MIKADFLLLEFQRNLLRWYLCFFKRCYSFCFVKKTPHLIIFFSLLSAQLLFAQYPKGYFMFPILPNQQNFLAGGMGDLRPNHFHAGIDIKTQFREGLPVYAAADGYVSKVAVMTGAYGNVVFLKHRNGMSTTYGHLREFAEPIRKYVLNERTKKETFEIELLPDTTQFVVKKGQVIGFSGNSGGSVGPHLHFEIRDVRDNILNPLLFGFKEITDNASPDIKSIRIRPLDINSRVAGVFETTTFGLVRLPSNKAGNHYQIPQKIMALGNIGLEALAFDRLEGVPNINGLSCIEVYVNRKENFYYNPEAIPHHLLDYINLHNDYATEVSRGLRYQRLYVAEGNILPFYKPSNSKGILKVELNKSYQVEIRMYDQHQNITTLKLEIVGQMPQGQELVVSKIPTKLKYLIQDNILLVKARNLLNINEPLKIFTGKDSLLIPCTYTHAGEAVFLYDLRKSPVASCRINGQEVRPQIVGMFKANQVQDFEQENIEATFEENSLFSNIFLNTDTQQNILTFGDATVPLRKEVVIKFKMTESIAMPDKTAVYNINRGFPEFIETNIDGQWLSIKTEYLGKFVALTDSIPPQVQLLNRTADALAFRINDNLSGIGEFKASINGRYILTDYDFKKALVWAIKRDSLEKFEGKLRFEVRDRIGNITLYEQ